jgi:hypothetical protein
MELCKYHVQVPYAIDEQYTFFMNFLQEPYTKNQILHIKIVSCETPLIVSMAIQDWETKVGSMYLRIQYIESDTSSKRIILDRITNKIKTIILDKEYTPEWHLINYERIHIAKRLTD